MCQITLTSVQGQSTNGVNATTIVLSGTAAAVCTTIHLEITACGATHTATVPVINGSWQHSFTGDCTCNDDVKLFAVCCDNNGNQIPGCNVISFQQPILCPPVDCCPTVQIVPEIGDCNADNERLVTFIVNVSLSANQSSCPLPYIVQLIFGDGSFGPSWLVTAVGGYSFTTTHYYNANANYTASLFYVLPNNLNCPAASVDLHIDSCNPDCCPKITDYAINIGDCNDACQRLVEVTTIFEPPGGSCLPAFLEWEIVDKNNQSINGSAFTTNNSSPRTEQFWLSPANSPYVAQLKILYPTDCAVVQEQFTVPECQSPATCPELNNFSYSAGKCVSVGDSCCREVSFTCDINVHLGCGNGPKPTVRINYGDGDAEEIQFGAGGPHGVTFMHRYCTEGDYLVTLETIYPVGCSDQTLIAHVPKCDPKECEQNGNGEKFCPCCIGLIFLVTSYFWFWTEGYYQGDLVVYNVTLGPKLGYASALYGLLVTLLIIFCYKLVKSCKKCWVCRFYRCMFWALIISIIMIVVMTIIAYYYGNMAAVPGWLPALINAIVALWAVYQLMQTEPCKTFYATGKCKQ